VTFKDLQKLIQSQSIDGPDLSKLRRSSFETLSVYKQGEEDTTIVVKKR
jgi:hypothetical protein